MKLTYQSSFGLLTKEETKVQKSVRYLLELVAALLLLAIAPVFVYILAVVGQEILNLL